MDANALKETNLLIARVYLGLGHQKNT